MKCKKLTVTMKNKGILSIGYPNVTIDYDDIKISIMDYAKRKVSLESNQEIDADRLFDVFCSINKLCMLGEGYFYDIEKVIFEDSISTTKEQLEAFAKKLIEKKMLSFYTMKSDFHGDKLFLLPIREYANANILNSWILLDAELIYPNNAFRYMTHIEGLPLDMRIAYITECFEPLAVYISHKTKERIPIISRKKENDNPTMLECLMYVVLKYGEECFWNENKIHETDCRLRQLVNNRVKLMHLKKDMRGKLLPTEIDLIIYSRKLHLLYRHAILQLIVVDKTKYKAELEQCVKYWDSYDAT